MNQTDPSSLEPIRTLEQCLGNGGEFGGWGQKSWLCLPLFGNRSLRLCKPFLPRGLAYGRTLCTLSRSVEIAPPKSTPVASYGLHSPPRLSPFRAGILVQVLSVSSTGPSPLSCHRHLLSPHTTSRGARLFVSFLILQKYLEGQNQNKTKKSGGGGAHL